MFKNLNIYCQGFQFDTTDEDEANFFNSVSRSAVTDKIDLKDFLLIQDLKLKRNFNTTDTGYNGRNNLFFESSNIDFKLTDLEKGHGLESTVTISSFFMLFDDTRFIKYKVQIYNSNVLVWQGIVYQEGIKEDFTNDDGNKVLSVLCLGWESEFKEYFSNKPLPIWNDGWQPQWLSPEAFYYTAPGGVAGWQFQRGTKFIELLSNVINSPLTIQSGISAWYISKNGWLHNKPSSEYFNWFVKSGYDRMWTEESVYGFMEKSCNAMGWQWFFGLDITGNYNPIIKKRGGADGLSTYSISYEDFIRWEVTKHPKIITYDYVIILDGNFVGGNQGFPDGYSVPEVGADHRGERMAVVSDKLGIDNNTNHWNSITGTAGSGGYELNRSSGYVFSKYAGETDEDFNIIVYTEDGANKAHTLPKSKILFVNGGDSGSFYTGCYMDSTSNFLWETGLVGTPMTDAMLLFKGCYGSMMFQQSGYNLINYQSYARTDEFKNNFRPFLNTRLNRSVTIRVKDLIIDPLQYVTVTGYLKGGRAAKPFLPGNKWAITSMETDLLNDITELQLSAE